MVVSTRAVQSNRCSGQYQSVQVAAVVSIRAVQFKSLWWSLSTRAVQLAVVVVSSRAVQVAGVVSARAVQLAVVVSQRRDV